MNEQEMMIDSLMRVLFVISDAEGTWFENRWKQYGISDEQKALISNRYDEWYKENIERKA